MLFDKNGIEIHIGDYVVDLGYGAILPFKVSMLSKKRLVLKPLVKVSFSSHTYYDLQAATKSITIISEAEVVLNILKYHSK